MIVAFNATAYDERPSGARNRAVGLAAALLRGGCFVRMYAPPGTWLRTAVAIEHGGVYPEDHFEHRTSSFDGSSPLKRALTSRRWFEDRVTRDTDAFVTDYYPVIERVPTLVTVHDLRYFAARQFEPGVRAAWFRAVFPRIARRAAGIVVPTRAVAVEASEFLGFAPSRATVVANGLSRAWRDAAPSAGERAHLLMIGFAERRKDLATALAALRRAPTAPPLVVVGRGKPPRDADDLVAAGRARFVGTPSDAEVVRLARDAAALLHPSRYEGFGMPVLEAMSVGVPVIAAGCAAVEEIAGGDVTLLPPGDVDAWAAAMADVPPLSAAARDRAHAFSWDAAATALRRAVECVGSSS